MYETASRQPTILIIFRSFTLVPFMPFIFHYLIV